MNNRKLKLITATAFVGVISGIAVSSLPKSSPWRKIAASQGVFDIKESRIRKILDCES